MCPEGCQLLLSAKAWVELSLRRLMAEPPELGVAAPLEFVGHPAFGFQPPRLGCGKVSVHLAFPRPQCCQGFGVPTG